MSRTRVILDVVNPIFKTFLGHSLKMALWKKPKHVAVMIIF